MEFLHGLLKLLIELDKLTNKTGGLCISFKIQHSASVIGQRPNFTIADYSASADCENCSFGHCLIGRMTSNSKASSLLPFFHTQRFLNSYDQMLVRS